MRTLRDSYGSPLPPGIKPKAPGKRRFGRLSRCHWRAGPASSRRAGALAPTPRRPPVTRTLRHKAHRSAVAAPPHGPALARLRTSRPPAVGCAFIAHPPPPPGTNPTPPGKRRFGRLARRHWRHGPASSRRAGALAATLRRRPVSRILRHKARRSAVAAPPRGPALARRAASPSWPPCPPKPPGWGKPQNCARGPTPPARARCRRRLRPSCTDRSGPDRRWSPRRGSA